MTSLSSIQQFEVAVDLPVNGSRDFEIPTSLVMEQHIAKALAKSVAEPVEDLLRWAIASMADGQDQDGKPIKRLTCLGAALHRQGN